MSTVNELEKIYQKNIVYFQKFYPDLYEKLQSHTVNTKYELLVDDSGYFNIEVLATGAKLYSDNSDLIAKEQVQNCLKDNSNTKKAIFIGTLLGLQIEKLIIKTDAACIMIIEPDLEIFKLSAFLVDYEALTKTRVAIFSIVDSQEIMENKVLEFLFTMFYHNDKITFLNAINAYQPFLEKIQSIYSENIFYTLNSKNIKLPKRKKTVNILSLLIDAQKNTHKGNYSKAIESYLHVIEYERYHKIDQSPNIKADILAAYLNLGNIFYGNRFTAEAYHCYGKCVYSTKDDIMVYQTALNNYVHINQTNKKAFTKMIVLLESYITEDTTNTSLINILAELFYITNQHAKAELFLKPFNELLLKENKLIAMLPTLPVIYNSQEDIDEARDKFEKQLDMLLLQDIKIAEKDLEIYSTFFFAYHNRNNKNLFSKLSNFYEKATPSITYEASHCKSLKKSGGKIKIGVVSNFLIPNHPILKMIKNVLDSFNQNSNYELHIFSFTKETHKVFSQNVHILNTSLKEQRKLISKYKLDVLLYPEIGMHPVTYVLAHARLAHIQCMFGGHPMTSGIKSIDYFFSNKDLETTKAQSHYREKLIVFDEITANYSKPTTPKEFLTKEELGLSDMTHNYLIPAKLQKIHPDFDKLLFKIVEADSKALFIFFEDNASKQWDEFIKHRILNTINQKHVTFRKWAKAPEFYSLLHHADAVLEPTVFGYGTTGIEAFSIGTPIVTLPGNFSAGRALNMTYKKMEFEELITKDEEEYIKKTIKLAEDKTYKKFCQDKILELNSALYNNNSITQELDSFFQNIFLKSTKKV